MPITRPIAWRDPAPAPAVAELGLARRASITHPAAIQADSMVRSVAASIEAANAARRQANPKDPSAAVRLVSLARQTDAEIASAFELFATLGDSPGLPLADLRGVQDAWRSLQDMAKVWNTQYGLAIHKADGRSDSDPPELLAKHDRAKFQSWPRAALDFDTFCQTLDRRIEALEPAFALSGINRLAIDAIVPSATNVVAVAQAPAPRRLSWQSVKSLLATAFYAGPSAAGLVACGVTADPAYLGAGVLLTLGSLLFVGMPNAIYAGYHRYKLVALDDLAKRIPETRPDAAFDAVDAKRLWGLADRSFTLQQKSSVDAMDKAIERPQKSGLEKALLLGALSGAKPRDLRDQALIATWVKRLGRVSQKDQKRAEAWSHAVWAYREVRHCSMENFVRSVGASPWLALIDALSVDDRAALVPLLVADLRERVFFGKALESAPVPDALRAPEERLALAHVPPPATASP